MALSYLATILASTAIVAAPPKLDPRDQARQDGVAAIGHIPSMEDGELVTFISIKDAEGRNQLLARQETGWLAGIYMNSREDCVGRPKAEECRAISTSEVKATRWTSATTCSALAPVLNRVRAYQDAAEPSSGYIRGADGVSDTLWVKQGVDINHQEPSALSVFVKGALDGLRSCWAVEKPPVLN